MSHDQSLSLREIALCRAIERAVEAADRIILDASDGSAEETLYLTTELAKAFIEKVVMETNHARLKSQFQAEIVKARAIKAEANPFSKGYTHSRTGRPVSDACGEGRHSECTETWDKCACTHGAESTRCAYGSVKRD